MKAELWAPTATRVELVTGGEAMPMMRDAEGWWRGPDLAVGTDYLFRVDDQPPRPDPRSRFQPGGVHAASRVIATSPATSVFQQVALHDAVIYELHLGTFTPTGTFDSAIERLDHLVALGITHVELMPIAQFPGAHGWGYDGVYPYAIHAAYGGPEGLDRFVRACHERSLAVLVDVVHNHVGPEGAYLDAFGPYHDPDHASPWGSALAFGQRAVRDFFIESALELLRDHDVDGLRLDAVHAIDDASEPHFIQELADRVHALPGRPRVLIAEYDSHDPKLLTDWHVDAHWNDDFHHALHVMLTGERGSYYVDFKQPDALDRVLEHGYHLDGGRSEFRGTTHGVPYGELPRDRLVAYTQSHDQVGNRAGGERLIALAGPARAKLAAALLLTGPFVPMLFQGEEWGASTPFVYFADFADDELRRAVRDGRKREHGGHDEMDPFAPATREACVLRWAERELAPHREMLAWYRALIALRHEHRELRAARSADTAVRRVGDLVQIERGSFTILANLARTPAPLPAGEVVLASVPVTTELPPDGCVVLRRRS